MGYVPNASTPSIARSTAKQAVNNSGVTIPKCIPVKITATGISTIDPSVESDIDAFAGLTGSLTLDTQTAEVVTSGIILDTGLAFTPGDAAYVSKSGGVTNVKPSIGTGGFVSGDFIIRLGIIAQNDSNISLRDLIVHTQVIGQL